MTIQDPKGPSVPAVESPQNEAKAGSKSGKKPQRIVKSKVTARNEKIQGTNDSSIVSKRSVERLYWSKRAPGVSGHIIEDSKSIAEFFRPFVAKPQRRSPNINRGYWTRMEAIMNHIEFTIESSPCPKNVIIGLGAGFDPYPFQYLYNHPHKKNGTEIVFLDVDFPDLIKRKTAMIQQAPEVLDVIGKPVPIPEQLKNAVQLQTTNYIALGCDLTKLDDLTKTLELLFDIDNTVFTFTAEVSITYMPQKDADSVIEWASTFKHSRFILLEQILPAGPEHAFAKTMLKHFNQLNTPLNSVLTYQQVSDQHNRFKSRGWTKVQAADLFTFYETAITREQKEFLDTVEAFDEWEEFVLFCQHYVILFASTSESDKSPFIQEFTPLATLPREGQLDVITRAAGAPAHYHKKFAAGAAFSESAVISNGGLSTNRTNDSVLISSASTDTFPLAPETFQERMCHTLTRLDDGKIVLVGGRLAPNKPLSDCWVLSDGKWKRGADLPAPRYRHHSIATLDGSVIVFGGKGRTTEAASWIEYKEGSWKTLSTSGDVLPNIYSSAVAWNKATGKGFIFGGYLNADTMNYDVFSFHISNTGVSITNISSSLNESSRVLVSRLGAKASYLSGLIYIVGGVTDSRAKAMKYTVIEFDPASSTVIPLAYASSVLDPKSATATLPIFVGFNMDVVDGALITYGGGAVCFSFGSYWDDITVLKPQSSQLENVHLIHKSAKLVSAAAPVTPASNSTTGVPVPAPVPEIDLSTIGTSFQNFLDKVYTTQTPHVMRNLDLGPCLTKWKDAQYLADTVGRDTEIIAHISDAQNMNFAAKNFEYATMPFADFVTKVFGQNADSDKKYYLRSLSTTNPKTQPAIFAKDFPQLAADFVLPPQLAALQDTDHHFSSPLRIATADTAIWLHYDVTANILFQVVGHKTVRLYPPSDAQHLSFPAGSSTSLIADIFSHTAESLSATHPLEVELGPGDAVFIPACWLHATRARAASSVSLNFFWRDLAARHYAAGRDVYGNRDVAAYEHGRAAVGKVAAAFEGLPAEVRRFYLQRLAGELQEAAEN